MISLESLDLSYNHFTGEIPVTLTLLDFLAYLNLSYNNLSGLIPTNPHFDTLYQDGTAYIGNKYLCGAPDGMSCSNSNGPSTNETAENRYDQENVLFVVVIFSGFVTGTSGVFLLLYLIDDNWRNRLRQRSTILSSSIHLKFQHRQRQLFAQFVTTVGNRCRVRPLPSRQR
ncbi:receptor-like protein 56 [Capsicum annuum]|uniref:receptor-like protein 56 n=1 Tax=Capsicum annuum TaxID=4072 RepID=UPI001FB13797|nr:receptor-like protein 56 [Capsicum annuum]